MFGENVLGRNMFGRRMLRGTNAKVDLSLDSRSRVLVSMKKSSLLSTDDGVFKYSTEGVVCRRTAQNEQQLAANTTAQCRVCSMTAMM